MTITIPMWLVWFLVGMTAPFVLAVVYGLVWYFLAWRKGA